MILILSPSKSMTMEAHGTASYTHPQFLDQSQQLIHRLRTYSTEDLMRFMAISKKLAALNQHRFNDWNMPFSIENAKQAVLSFTGNVYDGLDAKTLKKKELDFAQNHLRILSGLYGLLRPLDLIQPYRLEMGRPLEMRNTKNLYTFWSTSITAALNQLEGNLLINLASQEYFKAVDQQTLNKKIISPIFKDEKNGTLKIISFYAKKARGRMARFIIQHQITDATALQTFCEDGYAYNATLSSLTAPVFTRQHAGA